MSLRDIVDLAYDEADHAVTGWSRGADDSHLDDTADGLAERGLTSREREVARFLALRLSDKEIADRLSISPRTVSTHVTVILSKLGVHSRHDVTRFISEPEHHPGEADHSASWPAAT